MKRIIAHLLFSIAAVLFAASPTIATASPPHTGIQGRAYKYTDVRGKTLMLVEIEPRVWVWIGVPPIHVPVATAFTVVSAHNQREVMRVTTDSEGAYSVSLPPGKYILVPDRLLENPDLGWTIATAPYAIDVDVKAKQFTVQDIFYFMGAWGTIPE